MDFFETPAYWCFIYATNEFSSICELKELKQDILNAKIELSVFTTRSILVITTGDQPHLDIKYFFLLQNQLKLSDVR